MLRTLIGRTPLEIVKTTTIVVLALILAVSLQQLGSNRTSQSSDQAMRTAALAAAAHFAMEMSSYDYAHLEVRANHLQGLVAPSLLARIQAGNPDLVTFKATSQGTVTGTVLQAFVDQQAQVVVSLDQVVSNSYSAPGTHLSTLLSCQLDRRSQGWLVTDFRWLYPNTTAPP